MINMIEPYRINKCPCCGGRMKLVEVERVSFDIDEKGMKDRYMSEDFYDAFLECIKCKHQMDVEKRGMHYVPKKTLPEVKFEIKDYNPFQIDTRIQD